MYIGSVKLLKDSVASSPREKRNARKRSFEQSMSATAAKILKMEQEREKTTVEKVKSDESGWWSIIIIKHCIVLQKWAHAQMSANPSVFVSISC